ncbi:MAG: 2OG-Fe(II) oxygenase [Alphaproteobacteria bacterium]|nr:2OG-Fe(II) oxygenase [Alphaproteobacteria bacterium]
MLNLDALNAASVTQEPYPFVIVPGFIGDEALQVIEKDFPQIGLPGSFPLETLRYGSGFDAFMNELRGDAFRRAIENKLTINLDKRPTMITVRGQARARDGQIHTDSKTKLVTVLIYLNGKWEAPGGRLRMLRNAENLNDFIAEVPPVQGTLLAFINTPNAWHGHEPFEGQRRAIQLNWVTDQGVVIREKIRHSVSAFFKKLKKSS